MKDFIINGTAIAPGEEMVLQMPVGRLPSATQIDISAHVYRSTAPGPAVLVLAGVHGDEINGVEIVRRLIVDGTFKNLLRGSVVAIPVLNVFGFNHFSREVPDGKDVNRSFPGHTKGSLAARVARTLSKQILPLVDFGIDLHTGGGGNYNYPQIRYSERDPRARLLAEQFGAPLAIAKPMISRSLRKTAFDLGTSIIVYEGGENLRFDGISITKGMAGVCRLLHAQEMLADAPFPEPWQRSYAKSRWLRAERPGIFLWSKSSGHPVRKGEQLAVINDPYGGEEIPVLAPADGFIIGHTNAPVVSLGDALFHIGTK